MAKKKAPTTVRPVRTCNNCFKTHGVFSDRCLLNNLFGILVHEGGHDFTHETARKMIDRVDADMLWQDIGPILDRLRDGEYTYEDD
jgi:hypothetical protein